MYQSSYIFLCLYDVLTLSMFYLVCVWFGPAPDDPPQIKGEAEAFAVEAKGKAEAEQMAKKAEAFKQYKEGAMVDMLLEKLPLVSNQVEKWLAHGAEAADRGNK